MMEVAGLHITVDSDDARRAEANLKAMTGASKTAEVASKGMGGATAAAAANVRSMTGAAGQEATALNVSTGALKVNTAAHMANSAAARQAMFTSRNLSYQLIDIAQTIPLAFQSPLYALQNVGFQVAQIGQEFAGQGGFMSAIRMSIGMIGRFVAAFAPVGIAVGVVAAGFAAMTTEINRTAEVQVSFMDVMLASWQLLSEQIMGAMQPVIDWFAGFWDAISPYINTAMNIIIGMFDLAFRNIKTIWNGLPAALGDVMYQGAQSTVNGVVYLIRSVQIEVNKFFSWVDRQLLKLGAQPLFLGGDLMDYVDIRNPHAGASQNLEDELNANGAAVREMSLNGGYTSLIGERAQQIAAATGEVESLGGAASAANDNVKKLADDGLKSAADRAQELADNMGKAIGGALRGLIEGTKTLGDVLFDVLGSLAKFAAQQAANIFGGMGGGFGFLGSLISGFFGGGFANGGVFSAGHQVHAFAQGGIVNRPTLFPMANGAGLMGEAGPEAIMPLRRGPNGRLGVVNHAANQNGGGRIHITLGWAQDSNGNIAPVVKKIANDTAIDVVSEAGPGLVAASVGESSRRAPASLAKYQQQVAGGDYRD